MFGDLFSDIKDFDGNLLRNIKGIRESQDLFDDLGNGGIDSVVCQAAECRDTMTSPNALISRPFDYGAAIAYPFEAANWQRTRFSDGTRYGVWYGSIELETTIYESVYHWRRFVEASYAESDSMFRSDRRVITARCRGILISFLNKVDNFPRLVDPEDYSFANAVGAYMKSQNQNGVLTVSARCSGLNAAIFNQAVLSNPKDYCFLTYSYNPSTDDTVSVERSPEIELMRI